MAEVVRCPNCNAQLHILPNSNVVKCEYCDSEIIIDNIPYFSKSVNEISIKINKLVNTYNYTEEIKKWKKTFHQNLIIQAILTAIFGILMESIFVDIAMIIFIVAIFYSFIMSAILAKKRPLSPNKNQKNMFIDFIKVYPAFAGAFWCGMLIIAFIVSA
ncbi:MAG: hypothetical protein K2H26_02235 [Ruminococcus sp.]|nr:hypothetical protein [Ruminococcus sp.]